MTWAVLADVGPLYAAIDPDDQYHGRCKVESLRLVQNGIHVIVAATTLMETHSLGQRRLPLAAINRWHEEIQHSTFLAMPTITEVRDGGNILRLFEDQPITLFDATLAVLSRRLDIPVWTYDHHFDVMGVRVWR